MHTKNYKVRGPVHATKKDKHCLSLKIIFEKIEQETNKHI